MPSLNKICIWYKFETRAEKTKLLKKSTNGTQRAIKVKGQKLGLNSD